MTKIETLVRSNIRQLSPYQSARDTYNNSEGILMDANENPYGALNRYPDPYQKKLKELVAKRKDIATENIFFGNGSDEIIDIIFRVFCQPNKDKVLVCKPTYGMYEVSAAINDVEVVNCPLSPSFDLDTERLLQYSKNPTIKVLFLCNPNNPTGNLLDPKSIETLVKAFTGIVVVDEAYIDFAKEASWISRLAEFPNLIVLQTLSKSYGLAAARIGLAFASPTIVAYFNKVKPPYNISTINQKAAYDALEDTDTFNKQMQQIQAEKARVINALNSLEIVEKIYASETNFVLLKVTDAKAIYSYLYNKEIIIRNRHSAVANCIRISVGTAEENNSLLEALNTYTP